MCAVCRQQADTFALKEQLQRQANVATAQRDDAFPSSAKEARVLPSKESWPFSPERGLSSPVVGCEGILEEGRRRDSMVVGFKFGE